MKRIRKVSQSIPIKAKVVNSYSESEEETYSCDYVNEHKQDKLIAGTGIEITGENIINNIQANYSTEEVKIGTWIDGKPLYRKVINAIPTISNSNYQTVTIAHNINDLKNIHKCNGFLHGNTKTYILPTDTSATQTIGIREINNTNIVVYSKNENWSSWIAEIILEYTKTTD